MDKEKEIKYLYYALLKYCKIKNDSLINELKAFKKMLSFFKSDGTDDEHCSSINNLLQHLTTKNNISLLEYDDIFNIKLSINDYLFSLKENKKNIKMHPRNNISLKKMDLNRIKRIRKTDENDAKKSQTIRDGISTVSNFNEKLSRYEAGSTKEAKFIKTVMYAFFGFNTLDKYGKNKFIKFIFRSDNVPPKIFLNHHVKDRINQRINKDIKNWKKFNDAIINCIYPEIQYSNHGLGSVVFKVPTNKIVNGYPSGEITYFVCNVTTKKGQFSFSIKTAYQAVKENETLELILMYLRYKEKNITKNFSDINKEFADKYFANKELLDNKNSNIIYNKDDDIKEQFQNSSNDFIKNLEEQGFTEKIVENTYVDKSELDIYELFKDME